MPQRFDIVNYPLYGFDKQEAAQAEEERNRRYNYVERYNQLIGATICCDYGKPIVDNANKLIKEYRKRKEIREEQEQHSSNHDKAATEIIIPRPPIRARATPPRTNKPGSRSYEVKRWLSCWKRETHRHHEAALAIQCAFRSYISRCRVSIGRSLRECSHKKILLSERSLERQYTKRTWELSLISRLGGFNCANKVAVVIQPVWRMFVVKREYQQLRTDNRLKQQKAEEQHAATVVLRALYRSRVLMKKLYETDVLWFAKIRQRERKGQQLVRWYRKVSIDRKQRHHRSAITISLCYKKFLAARVRDILTVKRSTESKQHLSQHAATVIIGFFRRFVTKTITAARQSLLLSPKQLVLQQFKDSVTEATLIQKNFRVHLAKKELQCRRQVQADELKRQQTTAVRTIALWYLQTLQLRKTKREALITAITLRDQEACRVIQCSARVYLSKRLVIRARYDANRRREEHLQNISARIIQGKFRSIKAHQITKRSRELRLAQYREEYEFNAARSIQYRWLIYKARCEVSVVRADHKARLYRRIQDEYATIIQSFLRTRYLHAILPERRARQIDRAAFTIQKAFKIAGPRGVVRKLRYQVQALLELTADAGL